MEGLFPDPDMPAPASGIVSSGLLVEGVPDFEYFYMLPPAALPRKNEPHGTVMVLFVVPLHQIPAPEP